MDVSVNGTFERLNGSLRGSGGSTFSAGLGGHTVSSQLLG